MPGLWGIRASPSESSPNRAVHTHAVRPIIGLLDGLSSDVLSFYSIFSPLPNLHRSPSRQSVKASRSSTPNGRWTRERHFRRSE